MKEYKMGSINSIETMGLVDGPGIRVVVFFNGCKLRCLFCHNPEMWYTSTPNISSDELSKKILRYKPYFKDNGGVTFSGGEPLLQLDFLKETCKILKQNNINIVLDTAGVGPFDEELFDYLDLVIFDVKAVDKDDYYNLTCKNIDESLKFLKMCQERNIKLWLRQVIVPGINDNVKSVLKLKDFAKNIKNVLKIELLPYHTMAKEKYKKLGIDYALKDTPDMDKIACEELEKYLFF